jgi:quercetin dioxygenase-like cupin family protein
VTSVTEQEARAILFARGHRNIVTVTRPENYTKDKHEHPYEADIIIISGSMKIMVSDKEYNLNSGDEFQLKAGTKHTEFTGEGGAVFLAAQPEEQ